MSVLKSFKRFRRFSFFTFSFLSFLGGEKLKFMSLWRETATSSDKKMRDKGISLCFWIVFHEFPTFPHVSIMKTFEKFKFISWQSVMFINYEFMALRTFLTSFILFTACKLLQNDKFSLNKKWNRSFKFIFNYFKAFSFRLRMKKILKLTLKVKWRRQMINFYDFFAPSDSHFGQL